jgi:DNA polymerase III epsilon subunit-like protein
VIARDRAEEALWKGLRLAVIDTETTHAKGHGTKVVSIGLVTCRSGRIQGRWSTHVNPGIPISRRSTTIHGLRDEDVEHAPTFTDIAATLLAGLTPVPGEVLVVVAHNAAYDVPILREELAAAGLTLPDLPVLDTMGRLAGLAGVSPASRKLSDLLLALGLGNTNPHDALADAVATAQAACELLGRAAHNGHMDINVLLDAIEATTALTQTAATPGHGGDEPAGAPALPEDHLASHSTVLNARPAVRTLAKWTDALTECAALRCSHAADRVAQAKAPPDVVLGAVYEALTRTVNTSDHPGTATLLDAAASVLQRASEGQAPRVRRSRVLLTYDQWAALVAGTPRCETDQCPACRDGQPCGIDTWTYHCGIAAVGRWEKGGVWSFLPFTGVHSRTGYSIWGNWTNAGRGPLADAALWRCHEWWTENRQPGSATLLANVAWNAGCRHPRITDAYVDAVAAGGRPADLTAALTIADTTLAAPIKLGPPEHWRALQARRTRLAGQLDRGTVRYSSELDEDGNPIPIRRHHPEKPRRSRPTRFLRQPPSSASSPEVGPTRLTSPGSGDEPALSVATGRKNGARMGTQK